MEGVGAPVVGVAAAFGERAVLEVVDKCDRGAAVDPERSAQCLLGLALVGGEVAEHPEVSRVEVEWGEALGEAAMPVRAQLHQQEAGTATQPPRRGCLHADGISGHPRRWYRAIKTVCDIYSFCTGVPGGRNGMSPVSVRYITDDVEAAVDFYVERLGFSVELRPPGAGFAILSRGDLRLLLNEPGAGGAGQPMPDGRRPEPGGWNRMQLEVPDLEREVRALRAAGASFRGEIITGRGGSQILLDDPAGNPIELFEPAGA